MSHSAKWKPGSLIIPVLFLIPSLHYTEGNSESKTIYELVEAKNRENTCKYLFLGALLAAFGSCGKHQILLCARHLFKGICVKLQKHNISVIFLFCDSP